MIRFRAALVLATLASPVFAGVLQPNERIQTDFYAAQANPAGLVDFYALDGTRVMAETPLFRARYFTLGTYVEPVGNVVAFPDIREQGDTIVITSTQNLGLLAITNTWLLARHSPLVECRTRLLYAQPIDSVFFETIEALVPADSAMLMARDQRFVSAEYARTYVADKWTAHAAIFGHAQEMLTFPGQDNMLAMRVARRDNAWLLTYDLDRDFDHPFFVNWFYVTPPPHPIYDTLATTARLPGDSADFYFRFALGTALPIVKKERQPFGFEATLVMTEHADCEGPLTSKAIAYGSSEVDTPIPGRGILGNGLTWTKAVFRWHTYGGNFANLGYYGLDRPDFKEVIDSLATRGVEIASHTPSSLTDSAQVVGATLRDMRDWYQTRVWIDHGADYNSEALARFGTIRESVPWYTLDTVRDQGIDYAWQINDMSGLGVWDNNLFVPERTDFYPPILYTQPRLDSFGRKRPMYIWPAFPIQDDDQRDFHLGPAGIDRLIDKRGVNIVHVYFAAQDTSVRRYRPSNANWLIGHWNWPYVTWETDSVIDCHFQYMAGRQQAGQLRVATVSQWADYLVSTGQVELRNTSATEILVTNRGSAPVPGFALSMLASEVRNLTLDGQPITNRKSVGNDILFWFDIPADTTLVLNLEPTDQVFTGTATAPSQNSHVAFRNGFVHRIFSDGSVIRYQHSSDGGSTWSWAEPAGNGRNPSLALDALGRPLVTCDSAGTLRLLHRLGESDWQNQVLAVDTARWYPGAAGPVMASGIAADSTDEVFYLLYLAYRRRSPQDLDWSVPEGRPSLRLAACDFSRVILDTLIADGYFADCRSPSLAVAPGDWLHVAWQQMPDTLDRIFCRTTLLPVTPSELRQGVPLALSTILELTVPGSVLSTGRNPALATTGDSAVCYWEGANSAGQSITDIWSRSRWLEDSAEAWSAPVNVSATPDGASLHPVARSGVCLWQEAVGANNFDIFGRIAGDLVALSYTPLVSAWPQFAAWRSRYPDQELALSASWTESTPIPWIWVLGSASIARTIPAPFYTITCGESLPSRYCLLRDSFGNYEGHRLDIGQDSLVYRLSFLNWSKQYQLLCRFFAFHDSLTQDIYVGDALLTTIQIPPGQDDSVLLSVAVGQYAQTGKALLRFRSRQNSKAAVESITLFESDADSLLALRHNTQAGKGEESGPEPLKLLGSNPSLGDARFQWQVGSPGAVELRIFSSTGRLVRTVREFHSSPGPIRLLWNRKDGLGRLAPSGIYLCRFASREATASLKLVILN